MEHAHADVDQSWTRIGFHPWIGLNLVRITVVSYFLLHKMHQLG